MKSETEIKTRAFEVLYQELGSLDTERFISMIKRESFDYTHWRKNLPRYGSIEELSRRAMEMRNQKD